MDKRLFIRWKRRFSKFSARVCVCVHALFAAVLAAAAADRRGERTITRLQTGKHGHLTEDTEVGPRRDDLRPEKGHLSPSFRSQHTSFLLLLLLFLLFSPFFSEGGYFSSWLGRANVVRAVFLPVLFYESPRRHLANYSFVLVQFFVFLPVNNE